MGAQDFFIVGRGATPAQAFRSARDAARYQHGAGGYTGTIAEKDEYVVLMAPRSLSDAYATAEKLVEDDDSRVCDKFGPAGCIPIEGGKEWLFFGLASS